MINAFSCAMISDRNLPIHKHTNIQKGKVQFRQKTYIADNKKNNIMKMASFCQDPSHMHNSSNLSLQIYDIDMLSQKKRAEQFNAVC